MKRPSFWLEKRGNEEGMAAQFNGADLACLVMGGGWAVIESEMNGALFFDQRARQWGDYKRI